MKRAVAAVVLCLVVCKLLIHLYSGGYYGYFVDELYYIACSRHLDWGYVDQPPLIALIVWFAHALAGDSLRGFRVLAAVAGAGEVALTALIARELGGGRFAQGFAALATLCAPAILSIDGFLSMNAFEPLFWLGCAWVVVRIVNTGDQRLWIWFGVLAGFGLQNKYSMGIFGLGVVVGVILTPVRRAFLSPWFWAAGLIAFAIFLPNLLWNIRHHFPFLELQANIRRSGRDTPLGPLAFFGQEALAMSPLSAPLWLGGLWFCFFSDTGKRFRVLGWAWVVTAGVIVAMSPRIYYLFPAFPLLFAGGAVAWEAWFAKIRLGASRLRFAWPVLLAATSVVLAPLAIPVLPPETYVRYTNAIHLAPPALERHKLGPLPQIFADEFGWDDMAATVARVYNGLPADVRARTAIFGQNYGEAGAIDMFGPRYGLPGAISGHQNYFFWGPRGYTGDSWIVMDDRPERLQRIFTEVHKAATVYNKWQMAYRNFDVYYCRGMKMPVSELWPQVKNWD